MCSLKVAMCYKCQPYLVIVKKPFRRKGIRVDYVTYRMGKYSQNVYSTYVVLHATSLTTVHQTATSSTLYLNFVIAR